MRILFVTALLVLFPATAFASDYTGLGTIVIGFPIAIIAVAINLTIKISRSGSQLSYRLSGIATTATVLATLLISGDAISMFQKNDVLDKFAAVSLFVLTGVSVFIFLRIFAAKESLDRKSRNWP